MEIAKFVQGCPLCERCQGLISDKSQVIFESDVSFAIPGDHQFYSGYSMIISKIHAREIHNLAPNIQNLIMKDVFRLGGIISKCFQPLKINYASLGNVVEHLHWHVIPRYSSEQNPKAHPWLNEADFEKHKMSDLEKRNLAKRLQAFL